MRQLKLLSRGVLATKNRIKITLKVLKTLQNVVGDMYNNFDAKSFQYKSP